MILKQLCDPVSDKQSSLSKFSAALITQISTSTTFMYISILIEYS